MTATATVPQAALWSPAAPNLYELALAVPGESSYSARVGLRQITWRGQEVMLNGQRLRLHGATLQEDVPGHGDALTPADQDGLVANLKSIGANAVRAQHPLDPALLERLDAAGLLVWQGVGPVEGAGMWYSNTPRLQAEAEQQVRTTATDAALHPSIFAWNLVDEVAGNGRNSWEVGYVRGSARWLHANDPGRMVAVDIWGRHPPARAGALYSEVDAVAETDYTGWYEHPYDSPAKLAARMRARLQSMARTFPDKVLVISEFGAESNTLNKPGAPGSYSFQAALLEEPHPGLCRRPAAVGDVRVGAARLPADPDLQRRLDPPRDQAPAADRRAEPEGALHVLREAEAGGRDGRAAVQGAARELTT